MVCSLVARGRMTGGRQPDELLDRLTRKLNRHAHVVLQGVTARTLAVDDRLLTLRLTALGTVDEFRVH